jgi:hypothetical protein
METNIALLGVRVATVVLSAPDSGATAPRSRARNGNAASAFVLVDDPKS